MYILVISSNIYFHTESLANGKKYVNGMYYVVFWGGGNFIVLFPPLRNISRQVFSLLWTSQTQGVAGAASTASHLTISGEEGSSGRASKSELEQFHKSSFSRALAQACLSSKGSRSIVNSIL